MDYRDIRKAAFQEYVISTEHNSTTVPRNLPIQSSAAVGVAFVAAALALGVCLKVDFSAAPDLLDGLESGLRKSLISLVTSIRYVQMPRKEPLLDTSSSITIHFSRSRSPDLIALIPRSSKGGNLSTPARMRPQCPITTS